MTQWELLGLCGFVWDFEVGVAVQPQSPVASGRLPSHPSDAPNLIGTHPDPSAPTQRAFPSATQAPVIAGSLVPSRFQISGSLQKRGTAKSPPTLLAGIAHHGAVVLSSSQYP